MKEEKVKEFISMLKQNVASDIWPLLEDMSKKNYESSSLFKLEICAIVGVHIFRKTLVEYHCMMTGNTQTYEEWYDNLKKKIELEHEKEKREIEAIFKEHDDWKKANM